MALGACITTLVPRECGVHPAPRGSERLSRGWCQGTNNRCRPIRWGWETVAHTRLWVKRETSAPWPFQRPLMEGRESTSEAGEINTCLFIDTWVRWQVAAYVLIPVTLWAVFTRGVNLGACIIPCTFLDWVNQFGLSKVPVGFQPNDCRGLSLCSHVFSHWRGYKMPTTLAGKGDLARGRRKWWDLELTFLHWHGTGVALNVSTYMREGRVAAAMLWRP